MEKINLTEIDPLKRLQQFCTQGNYTFKINWNKFDNGFICECTVYYNLKRRSSRLLKKEVKWVETYSVNEAKRTIASIFLDNIGLPYKEPLYKKPPQIELPQTELPQTELPQTKAPKILWSDMVEG